MNKKNGTGSNGFSRGANDATRSFHMRIDQKMEIPTDSSGEIDQENYSSKLQDFNLLLSRELRGVFQDWHREKIDLIVKWCRERKASLSDREVRAAAEMVSLFAAGDIALHSGAIPDTCCGESEYERMRKMLPMWSGIVQTIPRPKWTVKEIAIQAMCSESQVRRVLRDDPHVSPTLRRRVVEAIDVLNNRIKTTWTITLNMEPVPEGFKASVKDLPIPPVVDENANRARVLMESAIQDYIMHQQNPGMGPTQPPAIQ